MQLRSLVARPSLIGRALAASTATPIAATAAGRASLYSGARVAVQRGRIVSHATATMPNPIVKDHSSLSNFHEVRVTHSAYELDVSFESKTIEGYAKLDAVVEALPEGGRPLELVLDTRDLAVHAVEQLPAAAAPASGGADAAAAATAAAAAASGPVPLAFKLDEKHKVLGSALRVSLPPGLAPGARLRLGVRFTTSPTSSAVQFLEPQQTAGGQHPYLFTQCQAIHARSLVPCQDSPGAKMSYEAVVRVPQPLTALMSAVPREEPSADAFSHLSSVHRSYPTKAFAFEQKVPIAPYLVALAVGQLESRELGPRTRVWSEPSMVDAGAYEFAETAKYLEAGEAIAGEYVWGRYDLLLLPPSFPYGGMENPCLTFVTPTLLAGDRSLTNVVAHEIAHSWTGNLVTNASWEHFWLNEGFTVFLERKIIERLSGPSAFQFHADQGAGFLAAEVARLGPQHPFTRLVPDLSSGVDPDDVFSKIPYEKGFYLLYYLQELVGGPSAFDPFLARYIADHRHATLTSDQFKQYFLDYFKDVPASRTVDWDTWFYAPGVPPVTNEYDTSLASQAYDLAMKWHTCDVMGVGSNGPAGASAADVEGWSSEQLVAFLEKLGEYRAPQPMNKKVTQLMATMYGLYDKKNSEIRCAWYRLAIPAEDEQVLPYVVDMLKTQGRMKYLRPLYRALSKSKMGRQLALDTFAEVGGSYHPIAKKMVAADLGVATA